MRGKGRKRQAEHGEPAVKRTRLDRSESENVSEHEEIDEEELFAERRFERRLLQPLRETHWQTQCSNRETAALAQLRQRLR
jgi:hypothetical protein